MICRAPLPVGRLNAFQRVMLQWSELHPYNAAHTYRLSGPLRFVSLGKAIQDALEHNGLGIAEIDPGGVIFFRRKSCKFTLVDCGTKVAG